MSRVEKLYNFIADQMVDQTEIVNRNETRLHFMQNRMDMYGLTQNDYFKTPTRFFLTNWIPPKAITRYLREVYGLSDGEVRPLFNLFKEKIGEIVLDRYPNIMGRKKPSTRKSRFNESKMDRYVDYIINEFIETNIVEDEDVFTGEDSLSFKQGPMHLYLREPKLLHFSTDLTLDEFMGGDFGIRVSKIFREKYHINDYNKILLLWKKICGKLLKDYYGNQTINESTNKQERYIEYIKDNLKKSVSFDLTDKNNSEVDVTCIFDFDPEEVFDYEMLLSSDWDKDLYYSGEYLFDKGFIKFLNGLGIYGINDINYFYHWYVKYIRNEFKKLNDGDEYINESTNKKNKFYDRIVDHFINTHCEISFFGDNSFNEYGASFYIDIEDNYNEPWVYFANDIKNKIKFGENSLYRNSSIYQRSFVYHLKNYGLTDVDEVLDVHLLIMKELLNRLEKLNKTITINESDDKQERFLNFVINDLVSNTIINYEVGRIQLHYIPSILPFHYSLLDIFDPFPHSFSDYCINTFGLTEDEVKYVWDQYKSIIEDKIINKEWGNINESIENNSKLEKLLDVMSDSFINTHYRVKVNQYYGYFRLIFTNGDMDWVVTKELIKKWSNEYIDWSEGYYEILKQDKIIDETPTANAFDQTFVDHLHPLGIKDGDVYQHFYKIVMNKLLEVVIKDTEYYTNKGYKQRKI